MGVKGLMRNKIISISFYDLSLHFCQKCIYLYCQLMLLNDNNNTVTVL